MNECQQVYIIIEPVAGAGIEAPASTCLASEVPEMGSVSVA